MSFDLHSSPFLYRCSTVDLISNPKEAIWSAQSFTDICGRLPGLGDIDYKDNFEVSFRVQNGIDQVW